MGLEAIARWTCDECEKVVEESLRRGEHHLKLPRPSMGWIMWEDEQGRTLGTNRFYFCQAAHGIALLQARALGEGGGDQGVGSG